MCREAVQYKGKGKTPWLVVSPTLAAQWKMICSEVEKFKGNTHTLALWKMCKIDIMLRDLKKSVAEMGEMTDSEDSNLVSMNTVESVDELTLFGVMSPSLSIGDSVKQDITNELNKGLDKVIDERFEYFYQL